MTLNVSPVSAKVTEKFPGNMSSNERPQNFCEGAIWPLISHAGTISVSSSEEAWKAITGGWWETFSEMNLNPVELSALRGRETGDIPLSGRTHSYVSPRRGLL